MTRTGLLIFALSAGLVSPIVVRASDPTPPAASVPALNLTAPQQQKLTAMENASRAQAGQLIGQIKQLRGRLSDLYGAYSFDVAEARRLNQELNRVQGQLLELHLSEQQQIRGILTPDQFVQLQAAIRQHGGWGDHRSDHHGPPDHHEHEAHGGPPPMHLPY